MRSHRLELVLSFCSVVCEIIIWFKCWVVYYVHTYYSLFLHNKFPIFAYFCANCLKETTVAIVHEEQELSKKIPGWYNRYSLRSITKFLSAFEYTSGTKFSEDKVTLKTSWDQRKKKVCVIMREGGALLCYCDWCTQTLFLPFTGDSFSFARDFSTHRTENFSVN